MIHTQRHRHSDRGRLVSYLIPLSIVLSLPFVAAHAEDLTKIDLEGLYIPPLGNTAETDRELIREIRDEQVFKPDTLTEPADEQTQHRSGSDNSQQTIDFKQQDVWDLIREGDRMNLSLSEAVARQKEQYISDAMWINMILKRASPFLQFIVARLDERNLPLDLALVPAIESSFQPHVSSPGEATGLWQIVPATAREIGLKRTHWFDGRADLVESTRAALDYISYLNAEFNGDWDLTLAAYNAGPGRVKTAIKRNRKAGKPTDFASLRLPAETRQYVPRIAALIDLIHQRPNSPLELPPVPNVPSFTVVDVGQRISLDHAAILAEERESIISELNAGLVHAVTAKNGPHTLLLPANAVPTFKANLAEVKTDNLYSLPRTHVVRRGESISTIAQRYGISQRTLRELNALTNSKILIGQKLAVLDNTVQSAKDSPNQPVAHTATRAGGTPGVHIVKRGESISTIAQRYRISSERLKTLNALTGNKILIGQKLAILDKTRQPKTGSFDYTIKPGDTLSEIAVRFNVKMADISFTSGTSALNKVLIPGKKLKIRSGT